MKFNNACELQHSIIELFSFQLMSWKRLFASSFPFCVHVDILKRILLVDLHKNIKIKLFLNFLFCVNAPYVQNITKIHLIDINNTCLMLAKPI